MKLFQTLHICFKSQVYFSVVPKLSLSESLPFIYHRVFVYIVVKEDLERLMQWTNTHAILRVGDPNKNFKEFIPAQGSIRIVFQVLFFNVTSDKHSVKGGHRQINFVYNPNFLDPLRII